MLKGVIKLWEERVAKIILCLALFCWAQDPATMPGNTWLEIPNTHLAAVAPSRTDYPNIQGVEGAGAVIDDWCGGALDTKRNRLVLWGGGHNGYYGNELYAFDIDSLKWIRLTDPTPNPVLCADANPDGTPNSRHTYGGLTYIAHADRFFGMGGALACPNGGAGGVNKTWLFDFVTLQWQNMSPAGSPPGTCANDYCTYDSATKKVWYIDASAWACGNSNYGLYSYDYDNNRWARHNSELFIGSVTVDTKRHVLLNLGRTSAYSNNYVTAFELDDPALPRQVWNTTGVDFTTTNVGPVVYNPVADKYVGWGGGAVYVLDPVTKVWTSYNPAGGPPSNVFGVTNGIWGRWQYVPKIDAFITVVSTSGNVYFYKLPAEASGVSRQAPSAQLRVEITASPNPFTGSTWINASLPETNNQPLSLKIFNIQGRVVFQRTSLDNRGFTWNPGTLPGGLYLLRAQAGEKMKCKTLFLQK
jgi:hypothetical protein